MVIRNIFFFAFCIVSNMVPLSFVNFDTTQMMDMCCFYYFCYGYFDDMVNVDWCCYYCFYYEGLCCWEIFVFLTLPSCSRYCGSLLLLNYFNISCHHFLLPVGLLIDCTLLQKSPLLSCLA